MGLKCVAIYRDGSKMSQPLNTAKQATEEAETLKQTVAKLQTEIDSLRALIGQPVRRRMADTRTSITHKFDIAGHEGYFTVGLYDDGTPGEMFITMSKEGSTIGGLMDTIATLTSVSLQYGVPLQDLVRKFANQRFEPSGYTKNPQIRLATSLVDYIFRWMGINFIPGYGDNAKGNGDATPAGHTIKPLHAEQTAVRAVAPLSATVPAGAGVSAISESVAHFQMDAPFCCECGTRLVRSGSCFRCPNCGTSLGCS
jgi:ribonucleoside-diphosphate reductase alpha chain